MHLQWEDGNRAMKHTTREHLKIFKTEFLRWVEKFGLKDWECHFIRHKVDGISELHAKAGGCVATAALCELWNNQVIPLNKRELLSSGKHEAIHLLLARLVSAASDRFVTQEDLMEREEEVVRILEKLL
jgi:hypothetical protein